MGTGRRMITGHGEAMDWVRAHEALSRLARERARLDAEEGRWLLAALRSAAHAHLGFGSFSEYVERLFGYRPRSIQEKLRVAEALETCRSSRRRSRRAPLSWSAARELTRVAVTDTEREWLEAARGKTVHQLEALVAGRSLGDRPASQASRANTRHVLRFDVTAETLALWREAMSRLRRDAGGALDDDAALLLMARHALGGPKDEGRASYQVALSICPQCRAGAQQASGELVPVPREVVAMAACDGQELGLVGAHAGAGSEKVSSRPVVRGAEAGATDTRHMASQVLEHGAQAGGSGHVTAPPIARATQTIPPAMRRAVLRRDQQRCAVPGCKNHRFLDVHHVVLRSAGGRHDADNLVTLCGAHHRAVHRGELAVSGRVSTGLAFRQADGAAYGVLASPRAAATHARVFAALRGLGFPEPAIRRVLDETARVSAAQELSSERLLRDAVTRLTEQRSRVSALAAG